MLLLHISDIHFKQKEVNRPDDPNQALRNELVLDVASMRSRIGAPVSAILITGDIAFAGKKEEYEFAYQWLKDRLCPAAGCNLDDVFVVPGNHDVDRSVGQNISQRHAKQKLREQSSEQVDSVVREYMRDPDSAKVLFSPIDNYNRFAANFLCELSPFDASQDRYPFACRDLTLNDGSTLRLWGFNTVLVSDQTDSDRDRNMIIDPSAAQIETEVGVTHLVMCHHPFNWLKNGAAFQERIERAAKIHLFGHEHNRRIEDGRRFTRIRAGAMQPDRDEPGWKPGYNLIDVIVTSTEARRTLRLTIWVRHLDSGQFIPFPDHEDKDPWEIEHHLPAWSPPAQDVLSPVSMAEGDQTPDGGGSVENVDVPTIRTVILKLLKLREHEQQRVIAELELNLPGDQNLRDYEVAVASVRRAAALGKLELLDLRLDELMRPGGGKNG